MDDQEKSVLLVKAMKWTLSNVIKDASGKLFLLIQPKGDDWEWVVDIDAPLNLYDPANMALAWRVLNWASELDTEIDDYSYPYVISEAADCLFERELEDVKMWCLPPADAQRLWLDKILELAIEAGIVEIADED